MFVPSIYQQKIFDWIEKGRGDAVVSAVAGSGKTTTLIQAAHRLPTQNALFAAFNTHIAKTLNDRLNGRMVCRTIHSIGNHCLYRKLGKTILDDSKYRNLCHQAAASLIDTITARFEQSFNRWRETGAGLSLRPEDAPEVEEVQSVLRQLVHYAQCTLTNPGDIEALAAMAAHYGIIELSDHFDLLLPAVYQIIESGLVQAELLKVIDYVDMVYLPCIWELQPKQFEWVFLDEAQDLSAAQLHLILKARARGGRMLFVGDRHQAIYGFAGADSEAFDRVRLTLNAKELPLSTCYRCPKLVVEKAQMFVPQIEASPTAPEGIVENILDTNLPERVVQGDLILCRLTAPLITLCIELIARKIPARVRGRDIGKLLTAIVREVAQMDGFRFDLFPDFLEEYRSRRLQRLMTKKNSEAQIESLNDRINGVMACYLGFDQVFSVGQLCYEIEGLFSDDRAAVILSTVHRAKGLEEKRVFILCADKLPLRWQGQRAWEQQQEQNLAYVAVTRAMQELYFVFDRLRQEPVAYSDSAEAMFY